MQKSIPEPTSSPLFKMDKQRTFAVIGAGAAGLCVAKYLLEAGFTNVTIFEIGTQIGGLWCYENDNQRSSCYKTLHINTARNLTNFSDFPFPKEVQMFPDHWDMHKYLVDYAKHFKLVDRIRFRSRVTDVRIAPDYQPSAPRWEVELEGGSVETFDRVIVASGHLSVPLDVPEYKDSFTGEYLHSHYYREPANHIGKRVCVIGVGNSACDIASDVCVTAEKTVLVARSGVMIGPKLLLGIPFTDLSMKIHKPWFPDWLRRKVMSFLIYISHGRMTDLGFKPLTRRAHPTTNATVVTHIAYKRIAVKQGIERIEGKRIFFVDGSSDEFDVVIAATGYLIDLPFILPEIVPLKDNAIDLYKRIVPPGWYGLYFMGFFNTTTALNLIFEYQARWIAALETGKTRLPSKAQMTEATERKRQWIADFYKDSPRHTIEEEHVVYLPELRVPRQLLPQSPPIA
ncbi:MAG: flavin-containing monooxygenase [Hyphomicrobiaceae bacterium]